MLEAPTGKELRSATPVILAAREGQNHIVKYLARMKVDLTKKDADGQDVFETLRDSHQDEMLAWLDAFKEVAKKKDPEQHPLCTASRDLLKACFVDDEKDARR